MLDIILAITIIIIVIKSVTQHTIIIIMLDIILAITIIIIVIKSVTQHTII